MAERTPACGTNPPEPCSAASQAALASRGRSSEPIAAGLRTDVSQPSCGLALRSGPHGWAGVLADTSHAGTLWPGQDVAAGSPRRCVRPGLRPGGAVRCGDEMAGERGKSQLQPVVRVRAILAECLSTGSQKLTTWRQRRAVVRIQ